MLHFTTTKGECLAFAERMNQEYPNKKCPVHPDKDSVIEYDCLNKETPFKVIECCCDNFRNRLEYLNTDIMSLKEK